MGKRDYENTDGELQMSLKEEIDLIVAREKKKLENRDKLYDQFREKQVRNFSSLLALLKEIESSFSASTCTLK